MVLVDVRLGQRLGGLAGSRLAFLQCLLRALALDDCPGHIGKVRHDLHVAVVVVGGFVTNPDDGHDEVRPDDRHDQLARDGGVSWGQSLAMRERRVVVVNDRPSLAHAVHPDTGLGDRVVGALPRGRAELFHGSGGPGRQRKRVLVWLDEVAETNRAVGQRPDHVQHLLQQLLQGVVCGRIEQRQSKPKCLFNPPALGNVGQYGAALTAAVIGGYRLDVHPQWRALLWTDRQIADLFGLALEYFFEKSVEGGAILRGDEEAEARPDQAGALQSQQACPGEIHLADRPVAIECHVADGREVVEVGVTFQPSLQLCPRPLQLLVLQLQLDLVDLQLLE